MMASAAILSTQSTPCKRFFYVLCMWLGLLSCVHSPTAAWQTLDGRKLTFKSMDATVNRLIAANDVKGMAVALIAGGQTKRVKGYGFRMVE